MTERRPKKIARIEAAAAQYKIRRVERFVNADKDKSLLMAIRLPSAHRPRLKAQTSGSKQPVPQQEVSIVTYSGEVQCVASPEARRKDGPEETERQSPCSLMQVDYGHG